jgi:hypothetical protein
LTGDHIEQRLDLDIGIVERAAVVEIVAGEKLRSDKFWWFAWSAASSS